MTIAPPPTAPPHCPSPACRFHRRRRVPWRYAKDGFYTRKAFPQRIQRYRCLACGRQFSDQTFSITYWMRMPGLFVPVFHRLLGCSAFRQIAREQRVSPETIARVSARLGRHCLLFHEKHRPRGRINEPLSLDGFESFEFSQYFPTSYHLAVGKDSHFFYGFTDSECRRRGSMTEGQKARRAALEAALGRPDPTSVEVEVAALLRLVAPKRQPLLLHTDSHHAYPRALRRVPHLTIDHQAISSRAARTPANPLFPVNLLDLLLRHCGANHKRETIAHSKRRASAAERLFVFLVWRNWVKSFSELERGPSTAMRLGLATRRFEPEEILDRRLFPSLVPLPARWRTYYRRSTPTRAIPNGRTHRLSYAY